MTIPFILYNKTKHGLILNIIFDDKNTQLSRYKNKDLYIYKELIETDKKIFM
jgi:hypothetical protein